MKYLVTGGAGFIGSHIVEELVKMNEEVIVLDDFSTGTMANLAEFKDKIQIVKGDIRKLEDCKRACQGVDFVLHQAGKRNVHVSWSEPQVFMDVNVTGTVNVLEAARHSGAKRVVFACSSSIYGNPMKVPQQETDLFNPVSPYAITKHAGLQLLRIYYETYGLETVSLIYFNVFGPRQDPDSEYSAAIPKFIRMILRNEAPTIYGDGEQSKDFTYVKNVVEGNLLACKAKNIGGQVFNTAKGEGCSVNMLIEKINHLLAKQIKPVHLDAKPGDVRKSLADPTKAHNLLGYQGKYSFDEGLKLTVEWFKSRF